ncbi:MAG TPA: error-prone DNA polymerase [Flavitalea sp.]|nr:error-prone DNA polymerase [Flavitalea sp.]
MNYTELQVTTNFSFLKGASHPEEIIEQAVALGYRQIGITDVNTFAGVVRAHVAAKNNGIRLIVGVHLELLNGTSLLAYPTNRKGYASLCHLLTIGNLRAEKGDCILYKQDLYDHCGDILFIALPPIQLEANWKVPDSFISDIKEYKQHLSSCLYIGAHRRYYGDDQKFIFRLNDVAMELGLPLIATNDVYYHDFNRRQLQDVLTCIRDKTTINECGYRLHVNAERYLKSSEEMNRLFALYPDAVINTRELTERCSFSLDELRYEYPEEITSEGRTPQAELTFLAWKGANEFYQDEIPSKVADAIVHELKFIEQMDYAPYFLTVYDIVRFARSRNILCQGRGSAANSAICFCLGITSVNPAKFDLLFERFLSAARNEPPDIDVDFEHERREEVIQYIYEKYGRDRAAIVATVTQQHEKGAIRDVAKAMGLSLDLVNKLASSIVRSEGNFFDAGGLHEHGININDTLIAKTIELTNQYIGFPRQLGQHTGGFVISRNSLSELCPVLNARMENRTCLEWNKDDIEALKFLKIDVLALGMLTCIRKAFDIVREHYQRDLTLATIPQDDPRVYDMICEADTIGVFQIESRAQQSMLPRLKPRCFYDLVIEVAIVRPGPIQGDMVHPYLRRRNGLEKVEYPSKELEDILKRTLGVPLFQEQAMKVAIVAAGFSPSEADGLRRSMATFKAKGMVSHFEQKLINGMLAKGYSLEYSKRVFRQLEGFGSYGFPESHAASFAQLVYVSSWLKCHYPDAFACALLNSLPMGFYQPAQIVIDASTHGVTVKPVDVNYSVWDNTLEEKDGRYCALRLGFCHIKGLQKKDIDIMIAGRNKVFTEMTELSLLGIPDSVLELLTDADAFQSMGLTRRNALWQASVKDKPTAIFDNEAKINHQEIQLELPLMTNAEEVLQDYASLSLSVKSHPMHFLRSKLDMLNITTAKQLKSRRNGEIIKVAGLVLVRQRPGTAKGVWFVTLEDETGTVNLVVFPNLFEQYQKSLVQSRVLLVEGVMQVEEKVIHIIVQSCRDISKMMSDLVPSSSMMMPVLSRADEMRSGPDHSKGKIRNKISIPESRNFR